MTARFDQVNYAALPVPDALEAWTFEGILDARMQNYLARWNAARVIDPALPAYDVATLETDPAKVLQEADAYRESILRQRVNDAVRATFLASAQGNDLVNRAAEYLTAPASGETSESLRNRAQLAWENLSIGGSYGGYTYQALSAAPVELADVAVYGHEIAGIPKGEVRIVLLGSPITGLVPQSVIDRIYAKFARDVRKVNDAINVVPSEIRRYDIEATLVMPRGIDGATIAATQSARAMAYAASRRMIGAPVTFGGVMAALGHDSAGLVIDVEMRAPWFGNQNVSDITPIGGGPFEAPLCTGLQIDWRQD